MRSKPTLALIALACLCLACAPARAAGLTGAAEATADSTDSKDGKPQAVDTVRGGAHVAIRTESDPAGSGDEFSNFAEVEDQPNLVRRVFVDSKDELFFGYELLVERAGDSKQFRVAVRPLSEDYLRRLAERPAFRKRRLHPSYNASAFSTAPQTIGDGDTFALDVLRNPRTGAKIVDVITVSLSDIAPEAEAAAPPRDFAVEDVDLRVTNYELRIGGERVHKSPGGMLSGHVIWLALRDRGRFIFSLVPRAGYDFQKSARLEGNKITFEWGGESFEWVSSEPVVGIGGSWNLWMLHDASYDFDLFDQKPATTASDPTFARKADEAARRAARLGTQADYGSKSEGGRPAPARAARRTRVIIGAANSVSDILPR
jgi:hypothetical protein